MNPELPEEDFFGQTRLTSNSRTNNADLNSPEGTSTINAQMVGDDPNLKDIIMQLLTTMNSKCDDMKNDMSDIKESYSSLKEKMHELRKTITDLKKADKVLKEEMMKCTQDWRM